MILSIIQIVLVCILVVLILLQSPSSDGISGFSSSQQNINSIMVKRSSSSTINKLTIIIAGAFLINTLLLVGINSKDVHNKSISDKILLETQGNSQSTAESSDVPFK